jgi:hypothetical protein
LYKDTNRSTEAEPLCRRNLEILIEFSRQTGHPHPYLMNAATNYAKLLMEMGLTKEQADAKVKAMAPDLFLGDL